MSAIQEAGIGCIDDRPFQENFNSVVTSIPPVINLDSKLLEARKLRMSSNNIKGDVTFKETKQLIENFKSSLNNILYYMSYEGSMVVCVLLSLNSSNFTCVKIKALPDIDRNMIMGIIGNDYGMAFDYINVRFDNYKNFNCDVMYANKVEKRFLLTNTVANPRKEDLDDIIDNTVSIKDDGDKISVGSGIVIDKKHIQRLIGVIHGGKEKESIEPETILARKPVAGRNAFELRTDILQMSLDFSRGKNFTEDQIITTAKKFYSFVENKRC